jgi:molybdopterin synthase sulfur carrier subunit
MIPVHLPQDLAAELRIPQRSSQPYAATLQELLRRMDTAYPGLLRHLTESDGSIRQHINVFLGERLARGAEGALMQLRDGEEVWVIRAISGG